MIFNQFNFMLYWIAILGFYQSQKKVYVREYVNGKEKLLTPKWLAFIAFFPILWVACMGPMLSDVPGYVGGFQRTVAEWSTIKESFNDFDNNPGFVFINVAIKALFGNNKTAFRVIIALIQSIPVVLLLRKYSSNYLLSLFIFVAATYHIGWMMNGLRQWTAAVIIYAATDLLIKKKYIKYIIVVLIASTIHATALIMIPIAFMVNDKAFTYKATFKMFGIIAAIIISFYFGLFDSMLEDTGYSNITNMVQNDEGNGTGFLRVLVNCVPLIIAIVGRNSYDKDDKIINICINMSFITAGLYVFSMFTDGITIGRLPGYTSLYNVILLPYFIKNTFKGNMKTIMYISMIGSYLFYYFYQMHFVSGVI